MHRGLFISTCNACSSKLPYTAQEVCRLHRTWAFLHLPAPIVLHCPASEHVWIHYKDTWRPSKPQNSQNGKGGGGGGITPAVCLGQDVLITFMSFVAICEIPCCFPLNSINPYHHHSSSCCDDTCCDCSWSRHFCGPLQSQEEEAKICYEQHPKNHYR